MQTTFDRFDVFRKPFYVVITVFFITFCSDTSGPLSTYELSIPVPAPYRPIFPAITEVRAS